jgi:hypothetical protein
MSSPIRPAKDRDVLLKDLDALLKYAPPRARENPAVVAADEPSVKQSPQSRGDDTVAAPSSGDLTVQKDLPHRRSLDPDLVPQPKPVKGDRAAAIALLLSGVTAIAALVAWVVVITLPGVRQQSANHKVHMVLPDSADGQRDQLPTATATARPPLNQGAAQTKEPSPNAQPEDRPSGVVTAVAGPVAGAIQPVTASSSTLSQSERAPPQRDNEEISTLIKLGQDFLRNRDFSSARLLLRRAAEAGSAAAALSLGETFDTLVIQRVGAVGVQSDAAEAREWYQRAAQLGSEAASQHLARGLNPNELAPNPFPGIRATGRGVIQRHRVAVAHGPKRIGRGIAAATAPLSE